MIKFNCRYYYGGYAWETHTAQLSSAVCVCHAWHLSTSLYASYLHDTIIFIIWLFSYRILCFLLPICFTIFFACVWRLWLSKRIKKKKTKKYERKTDEDDDTKWTHTLKQLNKFNYRHQTRRKQLYNSRCRIRMTSVHRMKIIPIFFFVCIICD